MAFIVTKTYLLQRLMLLALVAATLTLGLTACKSADDQSGKPVQPVTSEHPEHPK